jgi:hypothetical protein
MKHRSTIRTIVRSRLARAVIAGSALALAGVSVTWAGAPSGFKAYTSAVGGYRIDFPASWHAGGANIVVVFRGPTSRGIITSVNVTPLGIASTFGSVDALAGMVKQVYGKKGTKLLGVTKTRVAGNDARVVAEQGKSLSTIERTTMVVFLGHGRAWMIAYSASVSAYAYTLSAFRTMLSSFAFVQ